MLNKIKDKREAISNLYLAGTLHRRLGESVPREPPPISLDPACMPGGRAPPVHELEDNAAGLEKSKMKADAVFVAEESPEIEEIPPPSQKFSKKRKTKESRSRSEEDEEESRYSIPKAKRRRVREDLEGGGGGSAAVESSSSTPSVG